MKKIIAIISFWLFTNTYAQEVVRIYSPYSPGHSATPALYRIVEEANNYQNNYKFVIEFKPGGNQIIAVNALDDSSMAIIAPAYIENLNSGKIQENNYVPVYALGDACWAVVTNKPLTEQKEFVVGGVGFGNAAHLTALALGEKFKFDTRYIIFKSNNDALVNMVGNNGVELVIDKYEAYQSLKSKNPKMEMVAASCPARLPQEPNIKTLKEIGIDAPFIFNIIVSLKTMPENKRKEIGSILHKVTDRIGQEEIFKLSAMRPPQFDSVSTEEFYKKSIDQVRRLQSKYRQQIENSQKNSR